MRRNGKLTAAASACLLVFTGACSRNVDNSGRENARLLYDESVRLIHVYLDSIVNTRDSTEVALLNNNFVESVARLNFRYPANTDLHLTELENEILAKMTARFAGLGKKRLRELKGHPATPDPIRKDSVAGGRLQSR